MKHMTYSFILTIYYILFSYCTNNFHKILYRFYERVRALQDIDFNTDLTSVKEAAHYTPLKWNYLGKTKKLKSKKPISKQRR